MTDVSKFSGGHTHNTRGQVRDRLQAWRSRLLLRQCQELGADVQVIGKPLIRSSGVVIIGDRAVLYSAPIRLHLATGPNGCLRIGNDVVIGHGAGLTSYAQIEVGDGTVIGPYAIVIDYDYHDLVNRQAPGVSAPIRIGKNVRIGAWSVVLRGADIGDNAVIAAGSTVRGVVPAGARVSGT